MTETQLGEWLKQQTSTLDKIIAAAGTEFHNNALKSRSKENFGFDLAECQSESWHLKDGKDLCYDRPNTPFVYSLWYHARRVNTFLTHFANTLLTANGISTIEIFDLGAGTGAVQWAVGLVYHKMKESGIKVPKIKIINVDTSPFMLYYSKDYLWKYFLLEYRHCIDFSTDIEYEVNSWSNNQKIRITNPWITASYLFDISDTSSKGDYKKTVLSNFQEIIRKYKPSKFLLLTSIAKESLVDEVAREFPQTEFVIEKIKNKTLILNGQLGIVNQFRQGLFLQYKDLLNTYQESSIRNPASWHDVSFVGSIITKRQVEIFGKLDTSDGIKLHNTSIKVRRDVELNEEQKKAARNINQPSVIIGPAGCGKSIVITERIKNIVQEANYDPNLKILLTTFNVELLSQLRIWLSDILDSNKILRIQNNGDGFKIYFIGNHSSSENIRTLHFDMLPKYLGQVQYWGLVYEETHKAILNEIINKVKLQNSISDIRFDGILNTEFLMEEYHRVIYGLQVGIQGAKENYLEVSRKGRGIKLDKSRRQLVWQCLELYANHIYKNRIPSFTLRRQLFLNKLRNKEINVEYDYVVIDEFQDCTRADFEIFFYLLNNPNHLIISGDLAQAVHLGRSANIESLREAIRSERTMNDISWNYLDGSYRLPFRICEAIKKISEHINISFKGNHAARVLTPYKGSPPGARPIVVVGKNEADVSRKISEILSQYTVFELKEKCILEKDPLLKSKLSIDTDTVLRLKGLEKQCVVWSTRAAIEFKKEKFEFVYTILSRTSCILIIALFNDEENIASKTQEIYKEAIGLLDRERIIFWDKHTKEKFNDFCQDVQDNDEIDE